MCSFKLPRGLVTSMLLWLFFCLVGFVVMGVCGVSGLIFRTKIFK